MGKYTKDQTEALFKKYDADGSGKLEIDEFISFLKDLGVTGSEAEAKDVRFQKEKLLINCWFRSLPKLMGTVMVLWTWTNCGAI